MRFTTLLLPIYLIGFATLATHAVAQVVRVEAESGSLNGFSLLQAGFFSGGAAVDGTVANPTATYTFPATDGLYDVWARYCDEDDGTSSYELSGSTAGVFASWNGDQSTGTTTCNPTALLVRQVAESIELQQGETITFDCQRDPGEPCRVDYFEFTCASLPPLRTRQPTAFPGALGFGAGASGARGRAANVCAVTNLADSGPGTFRACAQQCAPAYITFEVSGYIDLSEEVDIGPNKTIECATAPGDGVVFRKSRLHVSGDNVILRGCRTWAGNEPGGQPLSVRDGIVVGNTPDTVVKDVIVANSSMMFATDENGGTWHPVENVTFQHNIFAWALWRRNEENQSVAGYGLLIGDDAARVSVVENYLAFHRFRSPLIKVTAPLEVVNNLVYCRYHQATDLKSVPAGHVLGNRYKRCSGFHVSEIRLREDTVAYVVDNTMSDSTPAMVVVDGTSESTPGPLFWPSVVPVPSSEVEDRVFGTAGPAQLISFEIDAFEHYLNGTGGIIMSVDELGGWPTLAEGPVPPDGDGDGMPDWWEQQHCGGPCVPTGDHDHDRYENIEEWFHSFYSDN